MMKLKYIRKMRCWWKRLWCPEQKALHRIEKTQHKMIVNIDCHYNTKGYDCYAVVGHTRSKKFKKGEILLFIWNVTEEECIKEMKAEIEWRFADCKEGYVIHFTKTIERYESLEAKELDEEVDKCLTAFIETKGWGVDSE